MLPPAADTADAAFTEHGPWEVRRDELTWAVDLPALRRATRAQVPELVRPRRLPDPARLGVVAGHLGWALAAWAARERRHGGGRSRAGLSRRLRRAAERLGPTYIKLGQIISSGQGLFPEELVSEFALLRDRVAPEPFEVVQRVVEQDLGRPLPVVFRSFDREPLASASIAQVHRATLATGEEVVVKVQRPTIDQLVRRDLRVMAWIAPFLVGRIPVAALANPPALVELFAETIVEELDFRLEAENMLDVAASFAALGQRGFVVPRPHPHLVTRRVLVMERLEGFAFDDVVAMRGAGVDTDAVVRTGMIGFMEGAMLHGIFHGDLHGGNLIVLPDGRIGLLDYGITARMEPLQRNAFLRLLVGATMNDITGQLAALRDLGALPHDTDLAEVVRDLGLDGPFVDPTSLSQEEMVREIQRVITALLGYGARLPKILMLYIKNLVFLDGAIATLAPDLDLLAEVANLSTYFATTHGAAIAAEVGMDPDAYRVDLSGIKASFGVDPTGADSLTYADLRARREVIRQRFRGRA